MFDTEFYMKAHALEKELRAGTRMDADALFALLESHRDRRPVVYNIETTNACNMRCEMCPRTTMMTRGVKTMDAATFDRIVEQLHPVPTDAWRRWEEFVQREYGIPRDHMSENHFFLYIIPRVIQLHGYGDPLLDPHMPRHVAALTRRGIPSYFSCNPANIDVEKTLQMFENGLSYIKYSIESVDDERHRQIRGKASNYTASYESILKVLGLKQERGLATTVIITMLDLNRRDQAEEFTSLKKDFAGRGVYIYLKSEDQQWYRKDYHGTNSVHWSEMCKHPWMSMTIKSNGEAAMCMEDYDNEIVLGDARPDSLEAIWNGEKYRDLRRAHLEVRPGLKCTERCDMYVAGDCLRLTTIEG